MAVEDATRLAGKGIIHGIYEGLIGGKINALLPGRGLGRFGRSKPLETHTPSRLRMIASIVAQIGVVGAVRLTTNLLTGGAEFIAGGAAGVASMAVRGDMGRRDYGHGQRERKSHLTGRYIGEALGGALLAGFVTVPLAEAYGDNVADAARWVGDQAENAGDHIKSWLDGVGNHIDANLAETGGGGGGTPEVTTVEVPEATTTEALGEFTGGYDPNTHFYEGTGYNAIANALMENYAENNPGAPPLDWHILHNHAFHTMMVEPTLEANDIGEGYSSVWEGAKNMSAGDTLTIDPDTIKSFVAELNEATGQNFNADDFMDHTTVEVPATGAEGINVEGLSSEVVQQADAQMNDYLEALAEEGATSEPYFAAIADGTLVPGTPLYEAFQKDFLAHVGEHAPDELVSQLLQNHGSLDQLSQALLTEHAVAPNFEAYMDANPIGSDPVGIYVATFENGSAAYAGMPDAMKAIIHQQLLDQAAQHFELAGARA